MVCKNRVYFLLLAACSKSQGAESKGKEHLLRANSAPDILLALLTLPHLNSIGAVGLINPEATFCRGETT